MFRRCCGKRNAKKAAQEAAEAAAAAQAAAAVDAANREAAGSPEMRPDDFRNIDNNSVLVEYQENVRQMSQSTETIPAAVRSSSLQLAAKCSSVESVVTNACNGRHRNHTNSQTTSNSAASTTHNSDRMAEFSSSASASASTANSRNSQLGRQLPHIVGVVPKRTAAEPTNDDQLCDQLMEDTTSDDNTIISCDAVTPGSPEQLRSCLSRRTSCAAGKHVEYKERAVIIDANGRLTDEAIALKMIEDLVEMHTAAGASAAVSSTTSTVADDDEVFSDSIEPQLPRGDMCTPYPKKRSSIPGLMFLPDWFGEESGSGSASRSAREMADGMSEPPVTPVGLDDLELRRHRFFNDLLKAAQATREHRVRFNPLGPEIALVGDDCNPDPASSTVASAAHLNHLVNRLERIVERLERTVSARELEAVNATLNAVIAETCASPEQQPPTPPTPSPLAARPPPAPPADAELPSPPSPLQRSPLPLLYNGQSVDLDILPTVINEDAPTSPDTSTSSPLTPPTPLSPPPPPLPQSASPLPPPTPPLPLSPSTENTAITMSVAGYEDIVAGPVTQYLQLSKRIGGLVAEQSAHVERAFAAQLAYLKLAATVAKPASLDALLAPTSAEIAAVQTFREKNRPSPYFNHLSVISESLPALGWVCVAPTPGPHIKEMNDAGQFYANRVLGEWKEKDAVHAEWTRSWYQTLTELQQFVRQHHTTGLVWSGKGSAGGAPPPPPPGGMPPPPPMLPPLGDMSLAGGVGDDRSALFSQINQGEDITKSLKKVTADMQTHKNTALRSGPAPFKAPAGPAPVKAPVAVAAKAAPVKEPVFQQDGKKWIVEYQKNNPSLAVENAEMNNVVYLFKCEGSTLTVKGKINGIIVDSCKKCSILFDNLVSSIEFVNCQSVQMQVLGSVPTISIDKTDGCQMYLSKDSLDVEIISSKSSEMNVLLPQANGDYIEKPIPEQFKTKIEGLGLNTVCVESLG